MIEAVAVRGEFVAVRGRRKLSSRMGRERVAYQQKVLKNWVGHKVPKKLERMI